MRLLCPLLSFCFPLLLLGEPVSSDTYEAERAHILALQKLGQYAPASDEAESSLNKLERADPNDARLPEALYRLGKLQQKLHRLEPARKNLARALGLQRKNDQVTGDLLHTLNDLSDVCRELGNYNDAFALAEEAIKKSEKVLPPRDIGRAALTHLLAKIAVEKSDALAEPLARKALEITQDLTGAESYYSAIAHITYASALREQSRFPEAEPMYLAGVDLLAKRKAKDDPEYVGVLLQVAAFYFEWGRFAKSDEYVKYAESVRGQPSLSNAPELVDIEYRRALLSAAQGDYAAALPKLQFVVENRRVYYGANHPSTASALYSSAEVAYRAGLLSEAEKDYQQAIENWADALGVRNPALVDPLISLGRLYLQIADTVRARHAIERSVDIARGLGDASIIFQRTQLALASVERADGNDEAADRLLTPAVAKLEASATEGRAAYLAGLLQLEALRRSQGKMNEALNMSSKATDGYRQLFGSNHPYVALALSHLGVVEMILGRFQDALDNLQEAISIARKGGLSTILRTSILRDLSYCFIELHRTVDARYYAVQANASETEALQALSSFTPERVRLSFASADREIYALEVATGTPDDIGQALLSRKLLVTDSVRRDIQTARRLEPDSLAELGRLKDRLFLISVSMFSDISQEERQKYREESRNLLSKIESIENRVTQPMDKPDLMDSKSNVRFETFKTALPKGSTFVDFVRYSEYLGNHRWASKYGALVTTRDLPSHWVVLGHGNDAAAIDATIQEYIAELNRSQSKKADEKTLRRLNQQLYDYLWTPIECLLRQGEIVYICPDGYLNIVPFASLISTIAPLSFAGQHYHLRYVSTARDLLNRTSLQTNRQRTAILFLSPRFQLSETVNASIIKPVSSNSQSVRLGFDKLYFPAFAPSDEAELLNEILSPWCRVTVLRDKDASEANLFSSAAPTILHFSTHAFFLPGAAVSKASIEEIYGGPVTEVSITSPILNPMYRAGIALAGAEDTAAAWRRVVDLQRTDVPEPNDDGIVTAAEASALDLHSTLLVNLAACASGEGYPISSEGVLGLRRGFLLAGAQNVLLSLWSIDAKYTTNFMNQFYRRLVAGKAPADALEETQNAEFSALARLKLEYALTGPAAYEMISAGLP